MTAARSTTSAPASSQPSASSVDAVLRTRPRTYVILAVVWIVALIAGLFAPYVLSLYNLQLAVQGGTLAIIALSVGWLLRQTGQLSFGQAAYLGVAAYVAAILGRIPGVPGWVAVLAGIAIGTVFAFLVALFIARTPGIAFSMLTLAIGMLVWVASTQLRGLTNGYDGLTASFSGDILGIPISSLTNPVVAWPPIWIIVIVVAAGLWLLSGSRFGRRLAAIRENEERTRFAGHGTHLPRVAAVTISGFVASLAGAVSIVNLGFISPELLFWDKSGLPLIAAVIGGVSSVIGPIIGAFGFTFLQGFLSESSNYLLIIGAVLMVVVIVAPGGVVDIIRRLVTAVARRVRPGKKVGDSDAEA
ncbi:branched-chain amino acid ABC transporter permease [Microbacterium sp. KRD172]|uniref:branched-chain amino acid ABC transporter permease n=1 Tax=Microbacterium sp. KRD172 TaxID=2729727 RepID=UPI0019D0CB3A|nr:branched-chain amino acid ABC transporter permease [Microbacterium sp. KRD172]